MSRVLPPELRARAGEFLEKLHPKIRRARARRIVEEQDQELAGLKLRLLNSYVRISAPLVLISQVQRSGGSLLSQLFDGHSRLLVHPHELKIGYPDKTVWPPIDPSLSPEENFRLLYERTQKLLRVGLSKGKRDVIKRNFYLVPSIQRDLFVHIWSQQPPVNERDILNHYFTSFFNAWLNFRGDIVAADFIVGFVPQLICGRANMDAFWATYPDGRVIAILRSPLSWYPSAKVHRSGMFKTIEGSAAYWLHSTQALLREKERVGSQVLLIDFRDLVERTEATMRLICTWLDIPFENVLLTPTYNGGPIGANTSFEAISPGVVSTESARRERMLSAEERHYLESTCGELYERALREVMTPTR